jgi:hypothetical protein
MAIDTRTTKSLMVGTLLIWCLIFFVLGFRMGDDRVAISTGGKIAEEVKRPVVDDDEWEDEVAVEEKKDPLPSDKADNFEDDEWEDDEPEVPPAKAPWNEGQSSFDDDEWEEDNNGSEEPWQVTRDDTPWTPLSRAQAILSRRFGS